MDRKKGAMVLMGKDWRTDEEIESDERDRPRMVVEAWLIAIAMGAIAATILCTLF